MAWRSLISPMTGALLACVARSGLRRTAQRPSAAGGRHLLHHQWVASISETVRRRIGPAERPHPGTGIGRLNQRMRAGPNRHQQPSPRSGAAPGVRLYPIASRLNMLRWSEATASLGLMAEPGPQLFPIADQGHAPSSCVLPGLGIRVRKIGMGDAQRRCALRATLDKALGLNRAVTGTCSRGQLTSRDDAVVAIRRAAEPPILRPASA